MRTSRPRVRCHSADFSSGVARRVVAILAVMVFATAFVAGPAQAYWSALGSGSGSASTEFLAPPTGVTVLAASAPDVKVTWTAGADGVEADGFFVTRSSGATGTPACGTSPTALITTTTSCTDMAVPDGIFTYVVTAVFRTWTADSVGSSSVVVENAAALAFVAQPTDALAETPLTPAVSVALRTADGDPYPSSGFSITLSFGNNPATAVLGGSSIAVTDASGTATFTDLSVSRPGVGYTLTATSPGLVNAVSDPFTISAPFLGAAQNFSILAGDAVTNTGASKVSGDVGVSPGLVVTGFPDGAVGGETHVNDASASAAQVALDTAYGDLTGRTATSEITVDLGGRTLSPGVYHSTAALALTGTLTLDGGGDPNAVFVFQSGAAFDTAANSAVQLINGAQAANVYWAVAGAAGTGAGTRLVGTILAVGAIALGAGTTLIGRALSRAAVTLDGSTIRFTDALPPTVAISGGSTAVTKNTTPTITGTTSAPASSPATVRIGGQTLRTTVVTGGTWSVTAAALTAGAYPTVVNVRDAAGNAVSAVQTLTVEVNPAPIDLGTAQDYAVLGSSVTNTGPTQVTGDLGSTGAVTGFTPGQVDGNTDIGSPSVETAQADLDTALGEVFARPAHTQIAGDMGGRTFHLGIHHSAAALSLTGTVTLDAEGNPDAVFIFRTDAAFNTAAAATVVLANGARAANVYWVVAGAAGTGADSELAGSILARSAITLGAGTVLTGRALSTAPVTLAGNTVAPEDLAQARQGPTAGAGSADEPTTPATDAAPTESAAAQPTTPAQPTSAPTRTEPVTPDLPPTTIETPATPTDPESLPEPTTPPTAASPTTDSGPTEVTS